MEVRELRVLRVRAGLTQEQLAAGTRGYITQPRLSQIERGAPASAEEIEVLARLFGVSGARLLRRVPVRRVSLGDVVVSA